MNFFNFRKNAEVAVIDFGSSKIVVFVGKKTPDGFLIVARGESKYAGFYDGEWLEPERLSDAVSYALRQAEQSYGRQIREVFVGVPGEFTSVTVGEATNLYRFKKRITKDDVNEIYKKTDIFDGDKKFLPIGRSDIYFTLDDKEDVADPIGRTANKMDGLISYCFASRAFTDVVGAILKKCALSGWEFVSSCLAQSLLLIEQSVRDGYALLLDVGYITSNVMLVCGEGLVYLKSFSMGCGNISADLQQVMEISFAQAEELKSKVNLKLEFDSSDNYVLSGGLSLKAEKANEVVRARIEEIADYFAKALELCPYEIKRNTPIYVTGGGLSSVIGGTEYFSQYLDVNVKNALPDVPQATKAFYTSAYGLLDIALKQK